MSTKVLIIGASGKYRSSDIYSWRRLENDQPLIGDYSNVVIYMPSLHDEPFEAGHALRLLNDIRKGVADALQGDIHVYYVISPPVQFPNVNSYALIPFTIEHDIETGKNFKYKSTDDFPYLNKVAGWQVAFKDNPHNFAVSDILHAFVSTARTNHEKNAAFRIEFRQQNTGAPKGKLTIMPPIMDDNSPSEAKTINELLDYFLPVEELEVKLPERYQAIALPGEADLKKEDGELEQAIANATTRRGSIGTELREYDQLKGLVAFKGKSLEKCVDVALKKLGVDYESTNTNKEDGNLALTAETKIPVEIKGHETKGSSEQDLRQVIARLKDTSVDQSVRGLLIVNPFYNLPDEERGKKKAFESSVVQQAKAFNIVLLDTRVLLEYVADQLDSGHNQLLTTLAKASGEMSHQKPTGKT